MIIQTGINDMISELKLASELAVFYRKWNIVMFVKCTVAKTSYKTNFEYRLCSSGKRSNP